MPKMLYDKSGRKIGEIESEVQLNGRRIIRSDYNHSVWGFLEESVDVPGRLDIYRHGSLYGFVRDNVFYDKYYSELGEVKSEESDSIVFDAVEPSATKAFEGFMSIFNPLEWYRAIFGVARKVRSVRAFLLIAGGCTILLISAFYVGGQVIQGAPKWENYYTVSGWQDASNAYNMAHIPQILLAFFGVFGGLILLVMCVAVIWYRIAGRG